MPSNSCTHQFLFRFLQAATSPSFWWSHLLAALTPLFFFFYLLTIGTFSSTIPKNSFWPKQVFSLKITKKNGSNVVCICLGFSLFYWWSNIPTVLFIHLLGFSWTWAVIALVIWLSEMRCTRQSNVAWGLFLPQPRSEWQCEAGTRPAQTKLSSFPVQSCPTAFLLQTSAFRDSSFCLHTVLPWKRLSSFEGDSLHLPCLVKQSWHVDPPHALGSLFSTK